MSDDASKPALTLVPAPGPDPLREAMALVHKDAIEAAKTVRADPAYDGDHTSKALVRKYRPKAYKGDAGAFWVECFQSELYRLDVAAIAADLLGEEE